MLPGCPIQQVDLVLDEINMFLFFAYQWFEGVYRRGLAQPAGTLLKKTFTFIFAAQSIFVYFPNIHPGLQRLATSSSESMVS